LDLSIFWADKVSYAMALTAGLVSFFSPCVLPLIPAWLTLVTGLSFDELHGRGWKCSGRMFIATLLFVLGFSLVFCALGAAAGQLGEFLINYRRGLSYAAGAFMIFFGLYLAGAMAPAFMAREKRVDLSRRPLGLAGAFVVGLGFAAGWTPCVGPILGSILPLAASEQSAWAGLKLLAVYSLGFALPFLALSLAWGPLWAGLARWRPVARWSSRVLGGFLIFLGLLVFCGRLNLLAPDLTH
jgi:cytochrome c-type biogenesis protein